jgi:glycosidase
MEKETSDPKTWQWTAADKLFLELLQKSHARGIRVIIDGVFNHTGRDFFAFKELRKNQDKSRYKDWYEVAQFDDPGTRRNEFDYKGWWGHKTLPIFSASADRKDMHPGPKAYVFEATKRWMRPNGKRADGIDGWRLDVADERPFKFWADWNALVRRLNPEAYTTAEIWKNAVELIEKGGFSASMNYNAFTIPVKGFLVDNNVAPSRFALLIDGRRKEFSPATAAVMQNLMGSHDTDRLASMIVNGDGVPYEKSDEIDFNKNNTPRSSQSYKIRKPNERERKIQRLVVLFQMTYVGAPMIYYGDEAGMWGAHDPDDRMPMTWRDVTYQPQALDPRGVERAPDEVKFNEEVFGFYKKAIALRRQQPALNHGDFSVVTTDDAQRSLVVSRRLGKENLVIAINRGDKESRVNLSFPKLTPIFSTQENLEAFKVVPSAIGVAVILPPLSGVVLRQD